MIPKFVQDLFDFISGEGTLPIPESEEDMECLVAIYVGAKQLISAVEDLMGVEGLADAPPPPPKPPEVVHLTCWRRPRLDTDH